MTCVGLIGVVPVLLNGNVPPLLISPTEVSPASVPALLPDAAAVSEEACPCVYFVPPPQAARLIVIANTIAADKIFFIPFFIVLLLVLFFIDKYKCSIITYIYSLIASNGMRSSICLRFFCSAVYKVTCSISGV